MSQPVSHEVDANAAEEKPLFSPISTTLSQCPIDNLSLSDASHSTGTTSTPATSTQHSCPYFTQEVDPLLIKNSLDDRIAYLTDFLNFTSRDSEMIRKVAPSVNDVIPGLVDDLYAKLFEFDITKKVFMTRNQGFDGPLPSRLEDLTLDSAQIVFRKVFMKAWARRVLTADYTKGKTWAYMDKVGIMHTGVSPFKHQRTMGIAPLNVPYRDCALTLGLVQNILQTAILSLPVDVATMQEKIDAVSAITKVLWIQNDLFARHYINE
ncbi:Protoglobin-domain-containing protein [Amylocystis lapponica]|nr:Protoglobin-domain-containing protein [Amylocystis lapponica]